MRKFGRKTLDVLIMSEIICNKCEGSCEVSTNNQIEYPVFSGLLEIEVMGRYFSNLLVYMEA